LVAATVIASAAKQSSLSSTAMEMDCFVAAAPRNAEVGVVAQVNS
jgi:hypothetical protein